jgi:hypothetical protein
METEGSLPCSKEPATCPYPEPNESNPHPQTLSYIENFLGMKISQSKTLEYTTLNITSFRLIKILLSDISGSHCGGFEDDCLLGCCA